MTLDRPLEIAAFLDQYHWGTAQAQALDGDFSPRRYARLTRQDGDKAYLMDADSDQKTPQFVAVAKILRQIGINAPEIYATDAERGLVLMQDFGTRNVGTLCDAGESARPFFLRAVEVLAQLHRGFDSTAATALKLPIYNVEFFTTQAELFLDAYLPFTLKHEASDEERQDFRVAWQTVLHPIKTPQSLMLRDFMLDNLMALPDGNLGVLDFQDAGIGSVAYDLASLCEEVRRDGMFNLLPDAVEHYRKKMQSPLLQADLLRACTILSAQRHTRILGIITQMAMKSGRRDKLSFLPRILQHLRHILKEPYLLPVQEWMERRKII